jgi:hypothetical protein
MQWSRSFPRILGIPKPESQQVSLFSRLICEPIARMEDAQIVDVLNVAFLEIQGGTVLLSGKVKSI